MITITEVEMQLDALRQEKKFIVEDAKRRIAQLDVAEEALQRLAAPLRKEIIAAQTQWLLKAQSSCRPISPLF